MTYPPEIHRECATALRQHPMKNRHMVLLLFALLLALVGAAMAENETPVVRTLDPDLQPKIQFLNPQYLVYAPAGNPNAKLPLLIFLHGAGEVGNDIQQVKGKPTAIWEGIRKFNKGQCLVVAPQCLKNAKARAWHLDAGRPQPPAPAAQGDVAGG